MREIMPGDPVKYIGRAGKARGQTSLAPGLVGRVVRIESGMFQVRWRRKVSRISKHMWWVYRAEIEPLNSKWDSEYLN